MTGKCYSILRKPLPAAFRNPKTLRDKFFCSKLRPDNEEEKGVFICARSNCDTDNILVPGNEFKGINIGEVNKINFHCNSEFIVYLLRCKICRKQYFGSTITKLNLRLHVFKSNTNQENLIEHFYSENHKGIHQDINVKIIDFCDSNDQEKRENFRMNKLRTLYPKG